MRPNFLARRSERLLLDWANLPETLQGFIDAESRLLRRYAEMFDGSGRQTRDMVVSVQNHLRAAWDAPDSRVRDWYIFRVRQIYKTHLERRRESLSPIIDRDIFDGIEPKASPSFDLTQLEAFSKAVGRFAAQVKVQIWSVPPEGPPPQTQFELVMSYFQRIGNKAAHCKNPECPAPYFFRKKSNQKYCVQKCAAVAERESKRRWWHENKNRVRRKSK